MLKLWVNQKLHQYLKKERNQLEKNMAIKTEEIKKAKKFLENNKISIKYVKPRLFAIAANLRYEVPSLSLQQIIKDLDTASSHVSDF